MYNRLGIPYWTWKFIRFPTKSRIILVVTVTGWVVVSRLSWEKRVNKSTNIIKNCRCSCHGFSIDPSTWIWHHHHHHHHHPKHQKHPPTLVPMHLSPRISQNVGKIDHWKSFDLWSLTLTLKNGGWKTILSFWGQVTFQGKLAVKLGAGVWG